MLVVSEQPPLGGNLELPEELVKVLPSDPFEQLDVARKITSVALSTRVDVLQSEASALRAELADKDSFFAQLQSQVDSLHASLAEAADKLAQANQDKENLVNENASLSNTVRKLSRDVSKLEVFKRTLMQSLQEEENSGGAPDIVDKLKSQASISSTSQLGDDDASLPPSRSSSMRAYISDTGSSFAEDNESAAARPRVPYNFLLASQTSTPRITPPGSPPSLSASVSPTRTSKPVSPRRHSISFSTSRGIYDERSSVFASSHGSVSSSDTVSQTGRTRVDGKEFFRQVR